MLVEVAYISANGQQALLSIDIPSGTSVQQVIEKSGILQQFPEIDLQKNKVGIFSQTVELKRIVNEDERIEIYRPLTLDPKQARMLRTKRAIEKR